jgi:ATP-dependent exoDNAse (exonuclease V) beta subunit
LFWLEHPHSAELDLQPVVTTGDAVHVVTYHRAKGLEWPVVINAHLDFEWRSRLWGVGVETVGEFDPHAPLANRVIRFWPGVFGDRTKLPVISRIAESAVGTAVQAQNEAENRRVAYVGLTRARDTVVLALPAGNARDRAWLQTFAGDFLLPSGDALALPGGLKVRSAVVTLEGDAAVADAVPFAPRRLPPRKPLAAAAALREGVNASAALPVAGAAAGDVVLLGERIALRGGDMAAIGTALHAVIAAELVNPKRGDRLERAQALLSGFGVAAFFDAEAALAAAVRFREWVERTFAPTRVFAEYPVTQLLEDGRVVRGWIDVLLETDAGWVVIDHKSSPRPRAEWQAEVIGYSGQIATYRDGLTACGKNVARCWIHLPVGGGLMTIGE